MGRQPAGCVGSPKC